jgi:nucleotide-binding universal stress UspA family protein
MYKKLLVPLDGSELAEKALPYALQLTRRLGLETTLLHVCGTGESTSLFMCSAYIKHLAETLTIRLKESKTKSASRPPEVGFVKGETVSGDVLDSILEYADVNKSDLILISKHGHSGRKRWLMGSVAHKVLIASRVPVLIIHPESTEGVIRLTWPRSILVLLDGSKLSETVLPHIEALSKQEQVDADITLFEVCEPPDLLADYPEAIMPLTWKEHVKRAKASSEQVCSTRLAEIQKELEARNLRVSLKVALGDNVIEEIIKYISEHNFDLVALTTHGRSGISEWPYGHVSDRLVQSLSVPLFLVRPSKQ